MVVAVRINLLLSGSACVTEALIDAWTRELAHLASNSTWHFAPL